MKTYIVTVDDGDTEYVEQLLRAAASGCTNGPVEISESKPLPARRRKKKGAADA